MKEKAPPLKVVLAENYRCFTMWCRNNSISPSSRNVRYINSVQDFRGLGGDIEIIEVCAWWMGFHREEVRLVRCELEMIHRIHPDVTFTRSRCTADEHE